MTPNQSTTSELKLPVVPALLAVLGLVGGIFMILLMFILIFQSAFI